MDLVDIAIDQKILVFWLFDICIWILVLFVVLFFISMFFSGKQVPVCIGKISNQTQVMANDMLIFVWNKKIIFFR